MSFLTAKEIALTACRIGYLRRICGPEFAGMIPTQQSQTSFDVDFVVNAAPIPASSSTQDHRAAWNAMLDIFEREWRAAA